MDINTVFLVFFSMFAVLILAACYFSWAKYKQRKAEQGSRNGRHSRKSLPAHEMPNDKLVIIDNLSNAEADKILTDFCRMYNEEDYQALPRLYRLNERRYAVTFPYDIDFEIFCYFVNYVHYPIDCDKSFDVSAWTATESVKNLITESTNQRVMLFIPQSDKEGDNVYLTTEDNIGYKIDFAFRGKNKPLDFPALYFKKPPIAIEELSGKSYLDYK